MSQVRNKTDSTYYKSIATLMGGSAIAQLFTLICSPILTRICSPEDLGVYALVTGAVTMFGAIMSLRYDVCIVSEPSEKKVFPLIKLSTYIAVSLSVFIAIGYAMYFYVRDPDSDYALFGAITGLLVLLMGSINILTAFNNRQRDYGLITKTYTIRVVAQNIFNIISGLLGMGATGLSLSQLIGYCAGVRGQVKPLLLHKSEIASSTPSEMKAVAKENRKQALMSAPATLANGMSYSLINYFIEGLYSVSEVGFYSISYRILGLPITIISGNVSRVFLERASREFNEVGNFRRTYKSTVMMLAAMGLPIGIAMIVLAPAACELIFGAGWEAAGTYISILTPMFILRFIAGGVNCAAIITKKQHIDLAVQTGLTLSALLVFLLGKMFGWDIVTFLMVLNIIYSIVYIIYIYQFWLCSKCE